MIRLELTGSDVQAIEVGRCKDLAPAPAPARPIFLRIFDDNSNVIPLLTGYLTIEEAGELLDAIMDARGDLGHQGVAPAAVQCLTWRNHGPGCRCGGAEPSEDPDCTERCK